MDHVSSCIGESFYTIVAISKNQWCIYIKFGALLSRTLETPDGYKLFPFFCQTCLWRDALLWWGYTFCQVNIACIKVMIIYIKKFLVCLLCVIVLERVCRMFNENCPHLHPITATVVEVWMFPVSLLDSRSDPDPTVDWWFNFSVVKGRRGSSS